MDASAAYVCQEAQPLGVSQVEDLLQLLGNTDLQAIATLSEGSRAGKSTAAALGLLWARQGPTMVSGMAPSVNAVAFGWQGLPSTSSH